MSQIKLLRTDSANADFQHLIVDLNRHLSILNGEKDSFYAALNNTDKIRHVVVAYLDGTPVGCGAFRPTSDGQAEVKRMFVSPELRGQGIGGKVLAELETWASEEGFPSTLLETSKRLTSAVSLYIRSEYSIIPNYGEYVGVEDSVCMQKLLVAPSS